MGFMASKFESLLFIRNGLEGPVCILLYVDDLVITGPDLSTTSNVKSQLSKAFEIQDLGDLHYFLGIKVIHTPNGILLSQRHYVLKMLYKFGMTDCRPIATPLDKNLKLCSDLGTACNETRSQQIVGSLIYLTITRPDLNYPIEVISQFMQRLTVCTLHHALCERH